MAARLAIARAQRQLSMEAGVHLQTRNFAVINQVGACSLSATLECDQFANAHPHDSHYDQQSFVGLAWRPANESICCGTLTRLEPRLCAANPALFVRSVCVLQRYTLRAEPSASRFNPMPRARLNNVC